MNTTFPSDYFHTLTGRFTAATLRLATKILARNGNKITAIFPLSITARELAEIPSYKEGIAIVPSIPFVPAPSPKPAEATWEWVNGKDPRTLAGHVVDETVTHLKIHAYEATTPAACAEWFPKCDCLVTRWI